MTGFAQAEPFAPHETVASRFPELSRRLALPLILPVAALGFLAAGLLLLLEPVLSFGPYAPLMLFSAGLGSLVGLTVLSYTRTEIPAHGDASASAQESVRPGVARPHDMPVPTAPGRAQDGRAGSAWRVLSGASDPGDETWLSWLPRERRRLGPAEDGIAPGVVSSPGRAGNLVAFPVRNFYGALRVPSDPHGSSRPPLSRPPSLVSRDARVDPGRSSASSAPASIDPPSTVPRGSPFSPDDLDRMFPPGLPGRTIFLDGPPQRVGRAGRTTSSASGTESSGADEPGRAEERENEVVPTLADLEAESDYVRATVQDDGLGETSGAGVRASPERSVGVLEEAFNPIPPHLRRSGPLLRRHAPSSTYPPRPERAPRSVCASCSKVVMNLRMSGPCTRCLRPICSDCLRESLASQGHGWCTDCTMTEMAASAAG